MPRRPNARERGYGSEWDSLATHFLRESPLCWGCLSIGVHTRAVVLDHQVPVVDAPDRVLDVQNLQPLCKHCHDTVKRELERRWRRGEIKVDDMRMGSAVAIKTVRRMHKSAIGIDGFAIKGT